MRMVYILDRPSNSEPSAGTADEEKRRCGKETLWISGTDTGETRVNKIEVSDLSLYQAMRNLALEPYGFATAEAKSKQTDVICFDYY